MRRFLSLAIGALPLATLVTNALAGPPREGPHYTRPPFVLDTAVEPGQFAVASDQELTVVLYRESAGAGRIVAKRSDGRSLEGSYGPAEAVSSALPGSRTIHRDSIHVVGNQAFAVWLEDPGPTDPTRLYFSRFAASSWSTSIKVNDLGVPIGHDILDFSCVVKPGMNGNPYVIVGFHTRNPNSGEVRLYGVVSADGGATFGIPFALSASGPIPGATATTIGGVNLDSQLGELHIAWSDDRNHGNGDLDVFYRRAILDFFGNPIFFAPLGSGNEKLLNTVARATGEPQISVNGEYKWTGSNQKYVGVAWQELDKGAAPTLKVRASHDSGTNFLLEATVAHTGTANVAVSEFDFETVGDTFTVTWADNARDDGQGGITIPSPAESQVWHCESSDGTDFDPSQTAVVQMASAFDDSTHQGHSPRLARSVATPDGSMIVFLEGDSSGEEVYTTFSDQEFGGEWHIDEYPIASTAQPESGGIDVIPPDVAYNLRYYNFVVVWQQETSAGSGQYDLVVGGYRPPECEIEGWFEGSTSVQFAFHHLPFQDNFAFVLISGGANAALTGNVLLPDGRKTGLLPDALYLIGLTNLFLFAGQVDPILEGAVTTPIPIPATLLLEGFPLSFCGVTWGPFGQFHIVTDFTTALAGPPEAP